MIELPELEQKIKDLTEACREFDLQGEFVPDEFVSELLELLAQYFDLD